MRRLYFRNTWIRVATVAAVGVAAYKMGIARGAGIPSAAPLYYAGTVVESGSPVTGARDIIVNVYDDPTEVGTHLQCKTASLQTAVVGGRFRIALADACVAAIHANPNLWVEVVVSGTSLGRVKMGAVPFAVEADHAVKADGLTTLVTASGVDSSIAPSSNFRGIYLVDQPYSASGAFSNAVTGQCHGSDLTLGGGCSLDVGSAGAVGLSYPAGTAGATPAGWTCVFQNGSASTLNGHIRVVCLPRP